MSDPHYLRHYRSTLVHRGRGGVRGLLRDSLDRLARRRGQDNRHALFLPRVIDLCGFPDDRPMTVLELGAGDGWALSYQRPGLERRAIDRSADFADHLAAAGIGFATCDLACEALPQDSDSVDLIMMNHVIEHIADPTKVMTECRRVLRPGGVLYMRTPDIRRVGWTFFDDYTHVRPYTPSSLRALAESKGFTTRFVQASDHTRINLDILSGGRWRAILFSDRLGGAEIEAAFANA